MRSIACLKEAIANVKKVHDIDGTYCAQITYNIVHFFHSLLPVIKSI